MANSTKLIPFFQKIDEKTLNRWKKTISHLETIRTRLENALKKDAEEYEEIIKKEFNK